MTADRGEPAPDASWLARRPTVGVRVRILATVLVLAGLGMALAGAASLLVQRNRMLADVDATLAADIREFRGHAAAAGAEAGASADVAQILRSALQREVPSSRNEVLLGLLDGRLAFVTSGPRPFALERETVLIGQIAALPADEPVRIREASTAGGSVRYAAVQLRIVGRPEVGTYVAAMALRPGQQQLRDSAWLYALLSAGALALIGVGGWLVAGRLLRPLRLLREAADSISHTDLTLRIPATGHDDVTDLTVTVNAMLDRLEAAFDTQRTFLDDAGHELRTPLTIVRGHLEVLDPGDPVEVAQTRALVLDELDRMARLVNDLIVLAKAGRPDFVRAEPVELDGLVRDVLDKAQALAPRRWVLDCEAGVTVTADPQRLTQALLQLADNAVRHTGPDDTIGVGASLSAGRLLLWVRDTGPGVAPEDAQRIFERFGRAGTARGSEGSGLGLAIVGGIAAAHGGRVRLVQARAGTGATFVLDLPPVLSTGTERDNADGDTRSSSARPLDTGAGR